MTQYLLSVIHGADDAIPADVPVEQVFAAVDAFNTELQEAGAWVFAGGLMPPESATTVDGTGTERLVTDGPYLEAKEHLGGFWVVEAADDEAALDWAGRASKACAHAVELRPFQGE